MWVYILLGWVIIQNALCDAQTPSSDDTIHVTYGSAIVLRHVTTDTRLFSTNVNWGFGSRQQIVTSYPDPEYDYNYFWHVKPSSTNEFSDAVKQLHSIDENPSWDEEDRYAAGNPVRCGDTIRLEHSETRRYLHSHGVSAPVTSGHYEVTGYAGPLSRVDRGDDFVVVCTKRNADFWMLNSPVTLRHSLMKNFLQTSRTAVFNRSNCPRCPVAGHFEVSVGPDYGHDSKWMALPGLMLERLGGDEFFSSSEESKAPHDEL